MRTIKIKLSKKQIEHFKGDMSCAYDTCSYFEKVLLQISRIIKKSQKQDKKQ